MTTDPIATAQRAIGAHDLPLSARLVLAWLALAYVAVALERWATHTGRTPVLLEAGSPPD